MAALAALAASAETAAPGRRWAQNLVAVRGSCLHGNSATSCLRQIPGRWLDKLVVRKWHSSSVPLATVRVASDSQRQIEITWSDDSHSLFHPVWLRDNCPAARHPASSQKLVSTTEIPLDVAVREAHIAADGNLHVVWDPDGHRSTYNTTWLRMFASDQDDGMDASRGANSNAHLASAEVHVPSLCYDDLRTGGDAMRWRLASLLAAHGAVLVSGTPIEPRTVTTVACMLGPLQPQIYGEMFDVRVTQDPINVAYSTEAIGPHMDLCYYESPPGIQLLHCLENDAVVVGGDSFLIDAFRVAENLRAAQPHAFDVLARIPATFIKDHARREQPVLMSYQRPHFSLSASGQVIGVFWSPPFEGPLRVRLSEMDAYYAAYRHLHAAIESAPAWRHRLAPGEVIVFNNRRMLHGRTAIQLPDQGDASRWLQGCYVNIDEFSNTYNKLCRAQGTPNDEKAAHLGNQDHAWPHTSPTRLL